MDRTDELKDFLTELTNNTIKHISDFINEKEIKKEESVEVLTSLLVILIERFSDIDERIPYVLESFIEEIINGEDIYK